MAFSKDQEENSLPIDGNEPRKSAEFLPRFFRTATNKKFLSATVDQLISEGSVEKINSFLGRKTAKSYTPSDRYLTDVSTEREAYQLEPAVVIRDNLDNVTFFKDYNDYINQLAYFNSSEDNHSLLNSQEFYSWEPFIDWDKFVNYREYYWLPNGPQAIPIAGQSTEIVSTYTITVVDDVDNQAYVFTPNGLSRNPSLTLFRGQTYRFEVDCPGHPIAFKTSRDTTDSNIYTNGVSTGTQFVEKGVIEFKIPDDAPNTLFYVSKNAIDTSGLIKVYDISDASFIDVESEVIGKKTYKSSNDIQLSNGMKVYFIGRVTPAKYAQGNWYVEGVGDKISLISEQDLQTPATFVSNSEIEFDVENFDTQGFDTNVNYPLNKDYILSNRASKDLNPWARYNRWFHKDVIELSAAINNQNYSLDQNSRATRPIIEFRAGLELFNFGKKSKTSVDLVDTFTADVFSKIEGSLGYSVDGVSLVEGMRVLFTADTDRTVNGRIFKVSFLTHLGTKRINLIEEADSIPSVGETVLALNGSQYSGKSFYYTEDGFWKLGQEKTTLNQPPLFNVYDSTGTSYSDSIKYVGSTFKGTKLLGYTEGSTYDNELGFGISYRNIGNIGDIEFTFYLHTDTFTYQGDINLETLGFDKSYLRLNDGFVSSTHVNGWTIAAAPSFQPVVEQTDIVETTNSITVNAYNTSSDISSLVVIKNSKQLTPDVDYTTTVANKKTVVNFTKPLVSNDVVQLESVSSNKKLNGFYKFPYNLERNPNNLNLDRLTLGEIINHVQTISDNVPNFIGSTPGPSNLRDLGNVSKYGSRIIQHSAPLAGVVYHLANKDFNLIDALRFAKTEYSKFKRNLIRTATSYGYDGDNRLHLDRILDEILKTNSTESPFYFSDMVPHGSNFVFDQTVIDNSITEYPLTFDFDLTKLSDMAVLVYLNDEILTHGTEYQFVNNSFVKILVPIVSGDNLKIVQYESTNGSYIPPTPSKLGLYPLYQPKIFIDNTYQEPVKVIQGHDGSITKAFDDYRDNLILEFELRIYNNVKISYDSSFLNLHDFISGFNRTTDVTSEKLNGTLRQEFLNWLSLISEDYTAHDFFDRNNPFTYNYKEFHDTNGNSLPGYWRGIYNYLFDTDRPHTHPWEMLGFSIMPSWWTNVYGPAPYTSDNLILWNDLAEGIVREPNKNIVINEKYARPFILDNLPVDENGSLKSPLDFNVVADYVSTFTEGNFTFGDHAPIESAWRKSSEYPFALLTTLTLIRPAKIFASYFDRSRQYRDDTGQIVYKTIGGNLHFNLENIVFPNISTDTERTYTSGLVNYIVDYAVSKTQRLVEDYKLDIENLKINLASKLGGFTTKDKFKLILDSRSPLNQENVFIPEENYDIILNSSSPIFTAIYSGVIIEKTTSGFIIKGYDLQKPEFKYLKPLDSLSDPVIRVGGISESFSIWAANKFYNKGSIVSVNNAYYRVTTSHTSSTTFESKYFAELKTLPIVGGREIILRKRFEVAESTLHYGVELKTIQSVVDFLLGYGKYLESIGFDFNSFNPALRTVANWQLSAKEFAFWSTQNWSAGSVITLSPASEELIYSRPYAVVDNIYDNFYDYSIFKQDGNTLDPNFTNSLRERNTFSLRTRDTADGIYHATLNLIQKEHVLILDNTTAFNDVIYDQTQGYRQERINVLGYRTTGWQGDFDVPGFIYDRAIVTEWEPWTDYALGESVKYKEFYYSAKNNVPGTATFEFDSWNRLAEKPTSALLPNWDYRAKQFGDFYDLDTNSFDTTQQKFAQHLIGYQKRSYLENIINDDTSQYKFYQGMIQEKGTQNSLAKLFDVLSAVDKDSIEFYEEWALRLGQYGASDAFEEVEFLLDENKFLINPQPFELVKVLPTDNDFVYRITADQVYLKPENYTHAPFPIGISKDTIPTAGYVNLEDIQYSINTSADLLSYDITTLTDGDYFWSGYDKQSWNVFRFGLYPNKPQSLKLESLQLVLTLSAAITSEIKVGEYLGIVDAGSIITGIYEIAAISVNTIKLKLPTDPGFTSADVKDIPMSSLMLYKFASQRLQSMDDLNSLRIPKNKLKEKVWIDGVDGQWKVWEYNNTFKMTEVQSQDEHFGLNVVVSENNNFMVASALDKVFYYSRPTKDLAWSFRDQLIPATTVEFTDTNNSFGNSIAISSTGNYLLVGAPLYANNNGYVSVYTKNVNDIYEFTRVIESAAPATDEQFGVSIGILNTNAVIAAKGSVSVESSISLVNFITGVQTSRLSFGTDNVIEDLSVSASGSIIVSTTNETYIVKIINGALTVDQTITYEDLGLESNIEFGKSVAISKNGNTIAIGAPKYSDVADTQGAVIVMNLVNGVYELNSEILTSPAPQTGEQFGYQISFNTAGDQLVIYSLGGSQTFSTLFDVHSDILETGSYVLDETSSLRSSSTRFDLSTTNFVETYPGIGNVRVYNKYDSKFIFTDDLEVVNSLGIRFGSNLSVTDRIYINDPAQTEGKIYEFSSSKKSWNVIRESQPRVSLESIKSVFLYDVEENTIISNLDFIDPVKGKILGIADQEISFKTPYDPATYYVGDDQVIVDQSSQWTTKHVGKLWWDLSTIKFVEANQSSVVYKANSWNTVFASSSVDVYEWIQSTYSPAEWDKLADTEAGLNLGISGRTKYGNTAYSVRQMFDSVTQQFSNIYYFWVKNKTIVPTNGFRKISANDVANLIANPKDQGIQYVNILGPNQFSLVNCKDLIANNKVSINFRYWTTEKTDNNIHTHYQLLAENTTDKKLNKFIEQKWFDSLAGFDAQGNPVPDPKLPAKLKYGILSKPRQSMFVNRAEALKQFIERVNSVLKKNLIIDDFNLTPLMQKDPIPTEATGKFDVQISTQSELRFVGTANISRATLTAVVESGRIVRVNVTNAGKGYKLPPEIKIVGTGQGAKLKAVLNAAGGVSRVIVENPGFGYQTGTMLTVRVFTALVTSDETSLGKWTLYTWNTIKQRWDKAKTQTFDTTLFWDYVDWYADGVSVFTKADFAVDYAYELPLLDVAVGQLVKVRNQGQGGWLLLEKIDNQKTTETTVNYKAIGREKGTIQFKTTLYDFANSVVGFSGATYDSSFYDDVPKEELKIIFNAIKDNLFIDNLEVEYNKLFFASLRYIFNEQKFVDWAFKTSFIKASHNIGEFAQKTTYQNDNLASYEAYINEVKPYRSKVREYVSKYNSIENTNSNISDFDLPPVYDFDLKTISPLETRVKDSAIEYDLDIINTPPYSNWLQNVGFGISSIEITNAGSEYKQPPIVEIVGNSVTNDPATAVAYISKGRVVKIIVNNSGSGYVTTPTVRLIGSTTGTEASAIVVVAKGLTRSNTIGIKFDRLSPSYTVSDINVSQTFAGTGSKTKFLLQWPIDLKLDTMTVIVNGEEQLFTDFSVSNDLDTASSYRRYNGVLTFTNPPANLSTITISYKKNINLLDAADRINYFYNPSTGATGKDLGQLMTGVDYGGVEITGIDFGIGSGWDALPWFASSWDSFDPDYSDYLIKSDGSTRSFTLPYVPADGEVINIYLNNIRIDDPNFDTHTPYVAQLDSLNSDLLSQTANLIVLQQDLVAAEQTLLAAQTDLSERTLALTAAEVEYANATPGTPEFIALEQTVITLTQLRDAAQVIFNNAQAAYDAAELAVTTQEAEIAQTEADIVTVTATIQTLPLITNVNAIMNSYVGDGVTNVITIPDTAVFTGDMTPNNVFDTVVFRKATSDGSFRPEANTFDVELKGGDLTYASAKGINPEEIIADGDGFVTPTSSHAPEEVITGQIMDTVDIKVYNKVTDGAPIIVTKTYIGDNPTESKVFAIGQLPRSSSAVLVKKNGLLLENGVDYEVKFNTETVVMQDNVAASDIISITSLSQNGSNILDLDVFIGDGQTVEFITAARWDDEYSVYAIVNGIPSAISTFKTDDTYPTVGNIGIRFSTPPEVGAIINYTVLSGIVDTISKVEQQSFIHTGLIDQYYTLDNPPSVDYPLDASILVELDGKLLRSSDNFYFDVSGNSRTYTISTVDYPYNSIDVIDVRVYLNGVQLASSKDYNWVSANNELKIKRGVASTGDRLVLSITKLAEYQIYNNNDVIQLRLIDLYSTPLEAGKQITVTTFANHNILDIERNNNSIITQSSLTQGTVEYYRFNNLVGGRIELGRPALAAQYVWVMLNGEILTPQLDYILEENFKFIRLGIDLTDNDSIEVALLSSNVIKDAFGYNIFKDMLNRTIYRRFDDSTTTTLAMPLSYADTYMVVEDASGLPDPLAAQNQAGVVTVDGERIEYLKKQGNILSQLRRGTLGTGVKNVYAVGTKVRDQGKTQTVPYKDEYLTDVIVSDGYSIASTIYPNTPGMSVTSIVYDSLNQTGFPLGGQVVTLTGTGFRFNAQVLVGDTPCSTQYISPTEITFISPAKQVGKYDLVVYQAAYTQGSLTVPAASIVVPQAIPYVQMLLSFAPQPNQDDTWYRGDTIPYVYRQGDDIEVFVGGRRLRKTPMTVWDESLGPDSPTGDKQIPAEFAVNSVVGAYVRLTEAPPPGVKILVQKRIGKMWAPEGVSLVESNYEAAKFVRATPVDLPR